MFRGAFTIIELLVVVAVLVILLSILLPSLIDSRIAIKRTECSHNQKQMVQATTLFALDHDQLLPPHRNQALNFNWPEEIALYGPDENVAHCPALEGTHEDNGVTWEWKYDPHDIGYGYNGFFLGHEWHSHTDDWSEGTYIVDATPRFRVSSVKDPSKLIVFADSHPKTSGGTYQGVSLTLWWPYINGHTEGVNGTRHHNAGFVAFADGHVEMFKDVNNTINIIPPRTTPISSSNTGIHCSARSRDHFFCVSIRLDGISRPCW